jgi:hypothetical protein
MDFPVCPSCGQSVIDDDVEDCPFCGTSMKAKPGSKPPAKPTAAKGTAGAGSKSSATASKPASAAPAKTGAGAGAKPGAAQPGPADDFPFDAEVPGAKTAIQAMPNPSKGRSHKVVCPMCETAGYVPPNAVGKDVKCANAKCMVPVFKVPAATVEAPPPPPPKKSNLMLVGGITAAVMLVGGAAAVFLPGMLGGTKAIKPGTMSEEDKQLLAESLKQNVPGKNNPVTTPPPSIGNPLDTALPDDKSNGDATPKTPDEFIAAALKQLNDACLKGEVSKQRSKAFCRQLAADACARAGDTKAANDHLAQLVIVGPTVPYYRIEPTLELFWNAWSAGDKAAAARYLDAAKLDAQKLPTVGRSQLDVASRLAAALAVSGRVNEGLAQLEGHQKANVEGQLSARLQMATDGTVSRLTMSRAVLPWTIPQAVAATASLMSRGQPAAGREWAEAQADEVGRVECLSVWAEGVALRQPKPGHANANAEIVDAVKGLSPALAARVWARAACGRFAADDREGAAATLKDSQDLLATISIPPEPEMPVIKQAIGFKLPPMAPLVQAATAAAEVSFAHTLWPDHREQAEQSLELALTFARGLAPAPGAVAASINQADQLGPNGLRDLIRRELAHKNDDLASQDARKYRKVLVDVNTAAQRRFNLQLEILSRLADAGLKNKVWTVVSDRSAEANPNRRDDFLGTPLMGELLEAFHGTETEKVIQGALVGTAAPARPEMAILRQLLQQGPQQAAQYASSLETKSGHRDELVLMVAAALAANEKSEAVLGFISRLEDMVLREDAYRLTAALLAQRGHADAVWRQSGDVQQATEKASLCRGLVVGLKAGPPRKELPEPSWGP